MLDSIIKSTVSAQVTCDGDLPDFFNILIHRYIKLLIYHKNTYKETKSIND